MTTVVLSEKEMEAIILIVGMILGALVGCLFGILTGISSERRKNRMSNKPLPKVEKTGEVTISDSKNNKKTIDGTMEGFLLRKVPRPGGGMFSEREIQFDRTWEGKDIVIILLEKPDLN